MQIDITFWALGDLQKPEFSAASFEFAPKWSYAIPSKEISFSGLNFMYVDYVYPLALFGLVSILFFRAAQSTGFFRLSYSKRSAPHISFRTLFTTFFIYLSITSLVAPASDWLMESFAFKWLNITLSETFFSYTQIMLLCLVYALFYLYCSSQSPQLFKSIWKNNSVERPRSVPVDIGMGILAWIISFPMTTFAGQICDFVLNIFWGFEGYEQVAVHYLKTTIGHPSLFIPALFIILILAPCIEEFLFRGCLQSFLKNYFSTKKAIVLSSLCFALFHFSLSQGLGNISLCVSLFVFALFLGFIYERQGSLFASVGLHMTFNLMSTGRMLFFPDS